MHYLDSNTCIITATGMRHSVEKDGLVSSPQLEKGYSTATVLPIPYSAIAGEYLDYRGEDPPDGREPFFKDAVHSNGPAGYETYMGRINDGKNPMGGWGVEFRFRVVCATKKSKHSECPVTRNRLIKLGVARVEHRKSGENRSKLLKEIKRLENLLAFN